MIPKNLARHGKRFGLAEKGRDFDVTLGSVEDRLPPTSQSTDAGFADEPKSGEKRSGLMQPQRNGGAVRRAKGRTESCFGFRREVEADQADLRNQET